MSVERFLIDLENVMVGFSMISFDWNTSYNYCVIFLKMSINWLGRCELFKGITCEPIMLRS